MFKQKLTSTPYSNHFTPCSMLLSLSTHACQGYSSHFVCRSVGHSVCQHGFLNMADF